MAASRRPCEPHGPALRAKRRRLFADDSGDGRRVDADAVAFSHRRENAFQFALQRQAPNLLNSGRCADFEARGVGGCHLKPLSREVAERLAQSLSPCVEADLIPDAAFEAVQSRLRAAVHAQPRMTAAQLAAPLTRTAFPEIRPARAPAE